MIKLEKNEYIKLCDHGYLCYVNRWGTKDDYYYIIAVDSFPKCRDINQLEVYGYGKTIEEALISGICSLIKSGIKSLPLHMIKIMNYIEIIEHINKEMGMIHCSETKLIIHDEKNEYGPDQEMSITIEDNKAYPILV